VMLTAADAPVDRIVGLAVGADDYVAKPFHPRELLVRVQALLRRRPAAEDGSPDEASGAGGLRVGRFRLDPVARVLHGGDGSAVPVSPTELAFLRTLAGHAYQSLSRRQLIELAGPEVAGMSERGVDLQICRLRAKIEREPRRPRVIRTVRGCGYMLVPRADEDGG
jgi:DNA-binding response OmpR family regulator